MALTDKLSAIGEAIRSKTGKEDPLTLDAMPSEIESIKTGGGGEDYSLPLLNKTIETIPDNWKDIKTIVNYSLFGCTKLKEIDFPNATSVGNNAFASVRNFGMTFERVNLPKVTTIGSNAFSTYSDHSSLPHIYLPEVTTIGGNAFFEFWFNGYVILPKLSQISTQAFYWSTCQLILPQNFVSAMATASWFHCTKVYVPANMLDEYMIATNWSGMTDKLFTIEESEEVLAKLAEVGYDYVPTTAGGSEE